MTDQQLPSVTDSDVESSSGQSSTIADRGGTDQFTSLSPSTITDSSRLNATRLELEKWQYQHTIQLVKLELSQKNMIIDSLKAEHQQQIEELQDNLAELKCDVKLHQQRLVAINKIHQDEKKDLKRQLEEANRLREAPNHHSYEADFTRDQIEQVLQQPLMTEDEYNEIIKTLSSSPSICDIVKIRLYELTHPFVNEGVWLRNELEKLQSELKEIENTCKTIDKKYLEQEKEMNCLQVCYDQLLKEKEKLNNQERHFDFKSQHYDTIKSECDTLERELEIVKRTLVEKEIREQSLNGEMEKAQKELTSCQHQVTLLRQDKDYLQRQVDELTVRFRESEERIGSLNSKLTDVTQSKEELYEQFLKQKREQKSDYETRLQQELETLRVKTNSEIDQIKVQTREMYERENRVLSQSRDGAMADRDRAVNKQKELEEKYEQAINELRQLQLSSDGRTSQLSSQLQMKSFECERVQLLQEETSENLRKSEKERQIIKEKLECLGNQSETTVKDLQLLVKELSMKLKDSNRQLLAYEKLEQELDDVVMQAAEVDNEEDAERVLFSYGFGTSLPTNSKRRARQSVQLARRVLKLERVNASLRQQLEGGERERNGLKEKVRTLCEQLELSEKPQNYLLEVLKKRDNSLKNATNKSDILEKKNKNLEASLHKLIQDRNQMSADLERLLTHKEELNVIKQMLLSSHSKDNKSIETSQTKDTSHDHCHPEISLQPQPTIFTCQLPKDKQDTTN